MYGGIFEENKSGDSKHPQLPIPSTFGKDNDNKNISHSLEGWVYRKLRCAYWRQWKTGDVWVGPFL